MKHKQRIIEFLQAASLTLVVVTLLFAVNAWAGGAEASGYTKSYGSTQQDAPQRKAAPAAASLPAPDVTRINVSFKLDPRLSGPTYGGERWVSPPTYMGVAAQDTVQARVEGVDAKGRPVRISPKWTPSDPEMVEVSPSEGNAVSIIVKRPGESTLEVATQGVSKQLTIKAENKNNSLQVQLSQQP